MLSFDYFFWVLFERFAPISMESPPPMQALYLFIILDCVVMYYYLLLFCLLCVDLFIYLILDFRTHVSSCVRGEIVTPNPD
jgi:hypothetical protein